MKVNITQQMKEILENYTDEVMHGVNEILEEVGEEAAEELHTAGNFRGTKYRSDWTSETEKKRTFLSVKVFNKKYYRLTHLLENGHKIVKKGQKVGETKAFPHIEEVNDKAQEKAVKRIEDFISK